MNKKFIDKISDFLLILLPAVLFFSYYPIIPIGANETMNLELSLPEIWLVLFSVVNLPRLKGLVKYYHVKNLALVSVVPLYATLSLIWSGNRLRTLLTVGVLWLVVYSILNIVYRFKTIDKKSQKNYLIQAVTRSLLASAVVVSVFCWIQCILDVAGVSRDATLLCRGCVSTAFGFPHPSGFAIEPQFMGNLLIAPVLLSYYLLFSSRGRKKWIMVLVSLFLSTTLFFTFSRGAVYAAVIGFILELILLAKSNAKKGKVSSKIAGSLVIFVTSMVISLCSQGLFAAIGPTNDSFFSGVTKSIHQMTLGTVDLRQEESGQTAEQSATETEQTEQAEQSDFSGYVPESTNRRLDLNQYAFETWKSDPRYIIIGAGLGSAGVAMNQQFPAEMGAKEIVQNEYVSLLLEFGLVGCLLTMIVVVILAKKIFKQKTNPVFYSVVLSFLLTLMFFSGFPNALQIYLLPALIYFL